MEKLESDLENFVRLCHLHEKTHNLEQALAEKDLQWKRRIGLDCGGHSCFYDADIPDRFEQAGDMRAICKRCSKTHSVVVREKEPG